ncbi:hypothetical protein [Nocardia sp. NPDC024068]|uniref:hypothetical protein n=1 Tax=Nocardia sp. NPDC024068 TaxID=3157197 RepID=UPI0033F9BF7E
MWHWTTLTGQYPEAVAFTAQVGEPEPTVTDPVPVADEAESEGIEENRGGARLGGYDLAG